MASAEEQNNHNFKNNKSSAVAEMGDRLAATPQ